MLRASYEYAIPERPTSTLYTSILRVRYTRACYELATSVLQASVHRHDVRACYLLATSVLVLTNARSTSYVDENAA